MNSVSALVISHDAVWQQVGNQSISKVELFLNCELRNPSTLSFLTHPKHPQSSAVSAKVFFLLQLNPLAQHIRKQGVDVVSKIAVNGFRQ